MYRMVPSTEVLLQLNLDDTNVGVTGCEPQGAWSVSVNERRAPGQRDFAKRSVEPHCRRTWPCFGRLRIPLSR